MPISRGPFTPTSTGKPFGPKPEGIARLESIQVLRGIAAVLVFVFHLVVTVDRYVPSTIRQWFEIGQFGVDLFFVISGFVMAHSVRNLAGHGAAAEFVARRVWRIVPLLYILTLTHLCLSWLRGGEHDMARIVNGFTVIPAMVSPHQYQYALVPAWTLGFEMTFYLLVAGAVALRVPALWSGVPILLLALLPGNGPLGSSMMIEFVFGLFAYELWRRGFRANPVPLLILAALLLVAPLPADRFLTWGIPAALIFLAVLSWEPGKGRIADAGKWLGTISYSLYLSHVVVFDALAPMFALFLDPVSLGLALGAAGLVIAWLVYEAVEAPLWRLGADDTRKLAPQN